MKYELLENYEKAFIWVGGWGFNVVKAEDTFFFYTHELKSNLKKSSLNTLIPKLPSSVLRAVKETDYSDKVRRYNLVSAIGVVTLAAKIQDSSFLKAVLSEMKVSDSFLLGKEEPECDI